MVENERFLVDKLVKHFLVLKFRRAGAGQSMEEGQLGTASCFVIHVGAWFLVTAAHVIEDVKRAVAQGALFDNWALHDEGAGHQFLFGVPIAFDPAEWWFASDHDAGLDYAAWPLPDLTVRALEAGGVVPLSEAAWRNTPAENFSAHLLVGIPGESVTPTVTGVQGRIVMMPLAICPPPLGYEHRADNMFFARIKANDSPNVQGVDDIGGMSGGPIFGVRLVDDTAKYSAIGIQSGWWPSQRVVSCCRLEGFAAALHDWVRKHGVSAGSE